MISIIIPAYNAQKYIHECIQSIQHQNIEMEVLVGIDNCKETYNVMKGVYPNVRLFYFNEHVGPFVIKNTLVDEAIYNNILFFDADDIMRADVLKHVVDVLENKNYIKLKYINFYEGRKIDDKGHIMDDAIVAIKKQIFNEFNGYYPWKCAADTELRMRLESYKIDRGDIPNVFYYRRLHGNNLTLSKQTGHGSQIRESYKNIINKNTKDKNWPHPLIKTICNDYNRNA